ncbi:MAG: outer membrane protein OmpA-like peptidoglycan-associated protein [Granulosicoccus sp.]|jgi:outer membrane protein OmpA-like peptidoglycan-associated protein
MKRIEKAGIHMREGLIQMPKIMFIPFVLTALVSMSIAGAVLAEGDILHDFKKRIYVNGGLGITQIEPESPSDSLTVSDNADTGAHLALGYDFSRFLSVEGYIADLGTAQIAFLGADVGSIDYQVFGLSALGYLYSSQSGLAFFDSDVDGLFRREGLSLYGRLGLGHMRNSSEGIEYFQDHSNHAVFGLGLEYGFANGIALRTEVMAMDTDATYLNVGILKRFGKSHVPDTLSVPALFVSDPVPAPKAIEIDAPLPLPRIPEPMTTPEGRFAFDRTEITPQFARDLDALAVVLKKNNVGIYINGHADWSGTDRYNMGLSERRATGVKIYLQNQGVEAKWLETRGFGETRPIADNTTEQGRAMNRRVEIELQ